MKFERCLECGGISTTTILVSKGPLLRSQGASCSEHVDAVAQRLERSLNSPAPVPKRPSFLSRLFGAFGLEALDGSF